MRIGLDCRLAGFRHAGIGRYIENLVTRLPALDKTVEWVCFFFDEPQAAAVLRSVGAAKNLSLRYVPIRHYTLQEQLLLPSVFAREQLDLLHVPHFNVPLAYRGRYVITIHDLLWHEQRGSAVTTLHPALYWFKYGFYRLVTRHAIAGAAQIVVPTKTVAQTLSRLYPAAAKKLTITKEGARQLLTRSTPPTAQAAAKPYLLYVGSLYPHKNVGLVLRALKDLPEYTLKLVGSRNVFQDTVRAQVRELGLNKRVEFLGYQTDEQLAKSYAQATALVQPSLSEGFGLTGVEAMALGTPVVASDIPIFHEVYQDAAEFFDPHNPASFIKAVRTVAKPQRRQALRAAGQTVAKQYSWDTMTQQTVAMYHSALSS